MSRAKRLTVASWTPHPLEPALYTHICIRWSSCTLRDLRPEQGGYGCPSPTLSQVHVILVKVSHKDSLGQSEREDNFYLLKKATTKNL